MSTEKPTLDGLRIHRHAPVRRSAGQPAWVLPVLIGLIVAGALFLWWLKRPKGIEVQTAVARTLTGNSAAASRTLLNGSGYVTARRAATVSSKVTGKVIEVLVEEGAKVQEGQVLARLDASNVEASLHLAEAQLEAARGLLEETKPNLAFAERELQRYNDLAKTKVVSDSDWRKAEMEALALRARIVRQQADIVVRQAEVDTWKQQLDDTIIRAPFGGMVISKNAQPGEMISPMSVGGFTRTGICTVVDMNSLEVEVDVNESSINRVQPRQPTESTLDSYPNWHIPGKVIAIIPTADRQKATVKVRVGFDQPDDRILPDMVAKVAFLGTEAKGADAPKPGSMVVVPKAALQGSGDHDVVWVVHDRTVERRAVTVGQTTDDESTIAAGLSGGEKVVVNPPANLTEGAKISEK